MSESIGAGSAVLIVLSCALSGGLAVVIGLFSIARSCGVKLSGGGTSALDVSALGACAAGMLSSPHHAGIGVCAVDIVVRGASTGSANGLSAIHLPLA